MAVPLSFGEGAFRRLLDAYRRNAERAGRVFTLTEEQFRELTKSDCFYCGDAPNRPWPSRSGTGNYIYNGVDRYDNEHGYTIENCVSCCYRCNKMKSDLDVSEFMEHIKKVYKNLRGEQNWL